MLKSVGVNSRSLYVVLRKFRSRVGFLIGSDVKVIENGPVSCGQGWLVGVKCRSIRSRSMDGKSWWRLTGNQAVLRAPVTFPGFSLSKSCLQCWV